MIVLALMGNAMPSASPMISNKFSISSCPVVLVEKGRLVVPNAVKIVPLVVATRHVLPGQGLEGEFAVCSAGQLMIGEAGKDCLEAITR